MRTILILAIVAMTGVGYGYDFSEEAEITNELTEADMRNLSAVLATWRAFCPLVSLEELNDAPGIIDLLTRCKDNIRTSIREIEILVNLYNSVATDGSKVSVDRSGESFRLLEDIEAALKALQ